jgi:hypothetical protein
MIAAVTVPPEILSIGRRFVQTTRGVVAFKLHRVFDVHAGPSSRHDDLVLEGVYDDGTLVSVRILSDTIGGTPQTPDQIAIAQRQWTHPKRGDVFAAPFDPRYFGEYRYGPIVGSNVSFTSLVKDAAHGTGTLTVDQRANVTAFSYAPSVMPQYATSGTVVDTRRQVLPGYWAVTQETQTYAGRYALWKGGATALYSMSEFRRYPSISAAVSAIRGERKRR